MTRRPLIGLPGRRKRIGQLAGFPDALDDLHVDLYFADYARSVIKAGGLPVHLPLDVDPSEWIEVLDGVVLTGGADIEPERYGHDNTDSATEPHRDEIEFALLHGAIERQVPVLGICRGLQVVNVYHGGTLNQHVPEHMRVDAAPHEGVHSVQLEPGTTLHDVYGDEAVVNSLHHQTIDRVGEGLRVSARADDGTIEAIEMTRAAVVAVQWHPEMMNHADPVFVWLVERAARRS
jgi:putative glutamine amidotransferase